MSIKERVQLFNKVLSNMAENSPGKPILEFCRRYPITVTAEEVAIKLREGKDDQIRINPAERLVYVNFMTMALGEMISNL